jgi:hypothetical protein
MRGIKGNMKIPDVASLIRATLAQHLLRNDESAGLLRRFAPRNDVTV